MTLFLASRVFFFYASQRVIPWVLQIRALETQETTESIAIAHIAIEANNSIDDFKVDKIA